MTLLILDLIFIGGYVGKRFTFIPKDLYAEEMLKNIYIHSVYRFLTILIFPECITMELWASFEDFMLNISKNTINLNWKSAYQICGHHLRCAVDHRFR